MQRVRPVNERSAEGAVHGRTIHLRRGDITTAHVDAVVNAANSALAGGGGVDGAIHRAGGPEIARQCREIGGCPPGEVAVTGAGNLHATHVIHAVAPIWRGGTHGEAGLLRRAYRSSLQAAHDLRLQSLAFPSLGTGAYSNPLRDSALIAMETVIEFLQGETSLQRVEFYLFSRQDFAAYRDALERVLPG
jgi:O-acetyl-ADP-ribose deacetylase (regulator of RNase III)